MLNPPLSILSNELLLYIVSCLAELPFAKEHLHNLSLTDRAFTQHCQEYIFRVLSLGGRSGTRGEISSQLKKIRRIFDEKPSISQRVRIIDIYATQNENAWLWKDGTFLSIICTLSESPRPPYELRIRGPISRPVKLEDPGLLVECIEQSFVSRTLLVLHLQNCKSVPLSLFLVCQELKEVKLDGVRVAAQEYGNCSDIQIHGQGAPSLKHLDFRGAHSLVRYMVHPPPGFRAPVVNLSQLRTLTLSPHERAEMNYLQLILNAASTTLEELYLTNIRIGNDIQLPLAALVDLHRLQQLRVFAVFATMTCGTEETWVIADINSVLQTIPLSTQMTNLFFDITVYGTQPFEGILDQAWVGFCGEAIRISSGKHLELDISIGVSIGRMEAHHPGAEKLYADILNRMATLSGHSDICLHYWNPTCWEFGVEPPPCGQVRGRCRR
ncbi:hypothetical protein CVT26_004542 [Gymnopilus dilepis]|uniref:F-box domain-containing protein n=1 Tax=Gymnopilus dilepis TaxID=231916 RepID=A0A409YJ67_9AGAR|nr:hypothetical protein CVT26_004542 [Gymnopilus dilepis]